MAKYLIKETVLVMRDGKRVEPTIGKLFDLTEQEVEDIKSVRPQAISKPGKIEEDPNSKPVEGDGEVDLSTLSAAQLKALATERGISFKPNASKADLIEALSGDDL